MCELDNIHEEIKSSPNTILIEQANYFDTYTKGVLFAHVSSDQLEKNQFGYTYATYFSVVSPTLDNYSYNICTIYSNTRSDYPLVIKSDIFDNDNIDPLPDFTCENEDQFISSLKTILSHKKTTKIIQTLYSKSIIYVRNL